MMDLFQIDAISRIPVYEQIVEQMKSYIMVGILKTGDQLPSVRALSIELSVNPNTIQRAYSELDAKGIIVSVKGRGNFISQQAREILSTDKRKELTSLKKLLSELKIAGVEMKEIEKTVKEVFSGKTTEGKEND